MTAPFEPKHTPGPWLVDSQMGLLSYVRATSGELIASCTWKYGQQDVPAIENARLIAAAPDLLAFAFNVLELCSRQANLNSTASDADRSRFISDLYHLWNTDGLAATNKATGEVAA